MGEPNVETVLLGNERDPIHLPRRLQIQQFREDIDIAHGTDPPLCPFVHRISPTGKSEGPFLESALYDSKCIQISFRTISGVLHRRTSIWRTHLIERKSNSMFHRSINKSATSSFAYTPASSIVVTSTSSLTRKPG